MFLQAEGGIKHLSEPSMPNDHATLQGGSLHGGWKREASTTLDKYPSEKATRGPYGHMKVILMTAQ